MLSTAVIGLSGALLFSLLDLSQACASCTSDPNSIRADICNGVAIDKIELRKLVGNVLQVEDTPLTRSAACTALFDTHNLHNSAYLGRLSINHESVHNCTFMSSDIPDSSRIESMGGSILWYHY